MLKKLLLTAFLVAFAFSANAQIAIPQLDSGFHTYGGAAAGWRYGNTVALTGISIKGKVKSDGEEVGKVESGINAKGPEDSNNPIPFGLAAFRGESFAGELYSNLSDGLKTDVECDKIPNQQKNNDYTEEKELRINVAYVLGDTLSIGLGYRNEKDKLKREVVFDASTDWVKEMETTTIGTSLSVSYRFAEIFFLAAGVETIKQTGTFKWVGSDNGFLVNENADFVENSWTNTMYGFGVIIGDPGNTQFRAEYSMINSPESEEQDDSGVEKPSSHQKTITSFLSAEVKFGDFLVSYLSEMEKNAELNNLPEIETTTTSMGLGWMPQEGLALSLYSLETKRIEKRGTGDVEINPTGVRFIIGYNF